MNTATSPRPTLADLRQAYAAYRQTAEWKARVRRSFIVWRSLGWIAIIGPLVINALSAWTWMSLVLSSMLLGLRYTTGWPLPLNRPTVSTPWHLSPLILSLCLLALVYTLIIKTLGTLAKAAGSRKATKREPQHLFGYGALYHEHWWNLIPVSPGVNWMENALLFGGHRSKKHPWKTFWRTVIAALIVRGWWVVGLFGYAAYRWSPVMVFGWVEHVASKL